MPDNYVYVQDPSNSQNFNRYACVLNNPLRYTDPTGEMTRAEFDAVVSTLSNSPNGGTWNSGSGYHYFDSQDEAFGWGVGYMNQYNAWAGGGGGSPGEALVNFNQSMGYGTNTITHPACWRGTTSSNGRGSIKISAQIIHPTEKDLISLPH